MHACYVSTCCWIWKQIISRKNPERNENESSTGWKLVCTPVGKTTQTNVFFGKNGLLCVLRLHLVTFQKLHKFFRIPKIGKRKRIKFLNCQSFEAPRSQWVAVLGNCPLTNRLRRPAEWRPLWSLKKHEQRFKNTLNQRLLNFLNRATFGFSHWCSCLT